MIANRNEMGMFHDGGGGRSSNGGKRLKMIEDDEEDGTKEEQVEFMKELEAFHKIFMLWRAVVQLGGYGRIYKMRVVRLSLILSIAILISAAIARTSEDRVNKSVSGLIGRLVKTRENYLGSHMLKNL